MSQSLQQFIDSLFRKPAVAANAENFEPSCAEIKNQSTIESRRTVKVVSLPSNKVSPQTSGIHTVRLQDVW